MNTRRFQCIAYPVGDQIKVNLRAIDQSPIGEMRNALAGSYLQALRLAVGMQSLSFSNDQSELAFCNALALGRRTQLILNDRQLTVND